MKRNHEETASFVRYVVRPEFIAMVLTAVGIIVAGGIAWGTLTSRVEAQEASNKAVWKAIGDNKISADFDHDQLTRIEERVIAIQVAIGGRPDTIGDSINKKHER